MRKEKVIIGRNKDNCFFEEEMEKKLLADIRVQ
jgi:hypothetical protein